MRVRSLLVLAVFSTLALGACRFPKIADGGGNADVSPGPGLGSDTGTPTGTPFTWPAPVVVGTAIWGGATGTIDGEAGVGTYVEAYVPLTNTSAGTVSVTIPGGLIVVSETVENQNGFFVQDTVIVLPPQTTTYWLFYFFCLNAHRDISYSETPYVFGPVTDVAPLLEIVSLLEGKDVAHDTSTVQTAVWEVTDYYGELTEETRAALQAFPAAP